MEVEPSDVPGSEHAQIRTAEFRWNAAYLALKPVTIALYTYSQVLVALRLFDIVNIRRRRSLCVSLCSRSCAKKCFVVPILCSLFNSLRARMHVRI